MDIQTKFPQIITDEDLHKYSTFGIGGKADFLYHLTKIEQLSELIETAHNISLPYLIIGKGSNVLFNDNGFRGLVIVNETSEIEINGTEITADSGVTMARLVRTAIENELGPIEKLITLPGTVGGAIYGNAGCHGLEIKDIFTEATIFDPETRETKTVDSQYLEFGYRKSKLKETGEIVLRAKFSLAHSSLTEEEKKEAIKKLHQERMKKQPFGASTGSFFKNPSSEKPAGMLIDQAGLKGKIIGKAQVSEKHGNFILNLGGATSKDVIELAKLIKREVKAQFDINLQEEVQIYSEQSRMLLQ